MSEEGNNPAPADGENGTGETKAAALTVVAQFIKDLSFENVHMVQGKMTIYKGPFLSTHSAASFLIDSPTIPDSGFNIEF